MQRSLLRNPLLLPLRSFTSSSLRSQEPSSGMGGIVKSILHGSPKAKAEGAIAMESHSKMVGRGKYVHEFQRHKVLPGKATEYKQIIEEYYTSITKTPEFACRLTGSWEIILGQLDTFVHVWEYDNFAGFDSSKAAILQAAGHRETFQRRIMPLLEHRTSQLCQEFAFWASSPPRDFGGIYEMRTYDLVPGSLLEWEHEWRRGLEARSHFVQPVGAWFSQVGRLHQVHHVWNYASMEQRDKQRAEAWKIDGWNDTVVKTVKLSTKMEASIMHPLDFSPLK